MRWICCLVKHKVAGFQGHKLPPEIAVYLKANLYYMLKNTWFALVQRYTADKARATDCWLEIETAYRTAERHYHNLDHLAQLLAALTAVQDQVSDWDAVLFALYYHDVVYDVLARDNEAQSAVLAAARLGDIGVPKAVIEKCKQHILATQDHKQATAGIPICLPMPT